MGDLSEKKVNGKYKLEWKDFEKYDDELNPDTLLPTKDEDKLVLNDFQFRYSLNPQQIEKEGH